MPEIRITWENGLAEDLLVEKSSLVRSGPEVVRRALRNLYPTRTSAHHVYKVSDINKGAGRAVVAGLSPGELRRLYEMIQIIEVSRKIGMEEPYYMDELPVGMQGLALRAPNPYNHMFWAGAILGISIFVVWVALVQFPGTGFGVFFLCCAAILLGMGGWQFIRGWRRRGWWHAARAQVKRDGEKMPELLRVFF